MNIAENPQSESTSQSARDLVVVNGYYGFDNLGDEAILEQLLSELERIVGLNRVVVLSNAPESTTRAFSVQAVDRWDMMAVAKLLRRSRLLISGGGGLFQDVSSIKSVIYYPSLIFLARAMGSQVAVYAQGIGPLKSASAKRLTRMAMSKARAVTVRDNQSIDILDSWGLNAELSADPVWNLQPSDPPSDIRKIFEDARKEDLSNRSQNQPALETSSLKLAGFSLRPSPHLPEGFIDHFTDALISTLPPEYVVVPLVLQKSEDNELLEKVTRALQEAGRRCINLESAAEISKKNMLPSQWMSLIGSLDLVTGMRLHALLMAVRQGVPCVGLAYDPKVSYLMRNSQQPYLNLVNAEEQASNDEEIATIIKRCTDKLSEHASSAIIWSKHSQQLACKNFEILDRILKG